jgi:hypothetical protein
VQIITYDEILQTQASHIERVRPHIELR